jgi:cytosine/adenosine deaminase-related metal-dependent hydrolase
MPMHDSDDALVIRDGLVIPMTREREFFAGDVTIRGGRIEAVGGTAAVDGARVLSAAGAAVLPGFVQGHVHVVQSLLRHQADGLELLDWLRRRTLPYEAALDGDAVEAAAELGIAELLAGGTTTALDFGTTHDHHRVFQAAERLGIRLVSGKTHMDIAAGTPSALVENIDRSLADAAELGDRWHGAASGRLRYAVAPRFALSCTPRLLEGCAELARSRGWLLQTHAAENRSEVEAVQRLTGHANIDYLGRCGLLGGDVVLAHGVHLEPGDIRQLAGTATTICHCPGANLKLGSGIADVHSLLAAGVRVVLGADGAPCNNRLSVFHEMSLAATLPALRHGPGAVDAWTILACATREGAAALHLDREIGTLEIGKVADVVVVELGEWSMLPGGDPASRLVFGGSAQMVRHTVVAGRPLVVDHRLTTADPVELRVRIGEAAEATRRRMEAVP